MPDSTRYPDVIVQLSGQDGNAFSIMARVQQALERAGASQEEQTAFLVEAKRGNYDDLLQTCMRWVEVA